MLLGGPSARYCWTSGINLVVCGRANGRDVVVDGRDVVVDGMQWRTAGKSAGYAGELVVSEPLDAVRQHLPF